MEWMLEEPIEEAEEVGGSSCNETAPTQPRSDSDCSPRATQMHLGVPKGIFITPPTIEEVMSAHADLLLILKPARKGRGHKDPELDNFFKARLEGMKQFMWTYINLKSGATGQWVAASLLTSNNLEKGPSLAKKLCNWM
jgi:hypothetical protein